MNRLLCSGIALALCLGGQPLRGQVTYSVDFQGPVKGFPDGGGTPLIITEGEILESLPFPGAPIPPAIMVAASPNPFILPNLGLPPVSGPLGAGFSTLREVDAISYGTDYFLVDPAPFAECLTFSVDEFSAGVAGLLAVPNVASEGVLGAGEAAADVFVYFPAVPMAGLLPAGPIALIPGNTQLFDGDGVAPPAAIVPALPFAPAPHGLGLVEPNAASPGVLPDGGSNLDALDVDAPGPAATFPIYFSEDCSFADVLEPAAVNSGSAAFIGVSGADVLMTPVAGAPPVVYAAGPVLGLDLAGFDTDDLDALALAENGIPAYQPSSVPFPPFDWGPGAADMLLFSVRRGSAVIGMIDSCLGLPIEESDILVPPPVAGAPPCILIAGENLALATARTGPLGPFGQDDLDALDLSADADGNSIPDPLDAAYCACEADIVGAFVGGCRTAPDGLVNVQDVLVVSQCIGGIFTPVCGGGTTADVCDVNCDGVIDACDLGAVLSEIAGVPACDPACDPPSAAPAPFDVEKNRYVSFMSNSGMNAVAYEIARTVGPFPGFMGYLSAPNADGISTVVPSPVTTVWPPVVHVSDCEIIPGATYVVDMSPVAGAPGVSIDTTAVWCDVVGTFTGGAWTPPQGVVNFMDVQATLQGFSGAATAPGVTRTDLVSVGAADPCLNRVTNIADVFRIILTFIGAGYPFVTDPALCPICP